MYTYLYIYNMVGVLHTAAVCTRQCFVDYIYFVFASQFRTHRDDDI